MPESRTPRWQATLMGATRIEGPLGVVDRLRTRTSLVLLAFLLLHRSRVHSREELTDRFWPDDEPEAARGKLRLALHSIRSSLGDLLEADRFSVRVAQPDQIVSDRDEFLRLTGASPGVALGEREGRLVRAVALYGGPFLPGLYDDWASAERERLESILGQALRELAQGYARSERWAEAYEAADRLVALEPYDEPAHELMLRSLRGLGRHEALARTLESIRERFAELGLRPGPTLQAYAPKASHPLEEEDEREPAFLGREAELARVLKDVRGGITTLWGPSGIGKTRLAREVLRSLEGERTAFVSVVGVESVDAFTGLLRTAFASDAGGSAPLEEMAESALPILIAIDNFESLPEPAGAVLALLRTRNPGLHFLVTSQRRLGLAEEVVVPLAPLDVPREGATVAQITASASVRLLRERVRERGRRLRIDAVNAEAFGQLCRRLDGLPLALELAAEWLDAMGPAEIVRHFEDSGRRLAARLPGRESRHFSLEAAISTSLGRLAPALRESLGDLSVFVGGCDLEAAVAVMEVEDPAAALAEFEGRALVKVIPAGTGVRYELLDSIRSHLRRSSKAETLAASLRRHAEHYAMIAFAMRDRADELTVRYAPDAGNLRLAAETLLREEPDATRFAETIIGFARFWQRRGEWDLAHSSLRSALDRLPPDPSPLRASLYNWIGIVGHATNDLHLAEWGFGRRRDTFAALGDEHAVAFSAGNLALVKVNGGKFDEAVPLLRGYHAAVYEKDLSLVGQGRLYADQNLGDALLCVGEDEEGFALLQKALGTSVDTEAAAMVALTCSTLGWHYWLRGRAEEAGPYLRRSIEVYREIGDPQGELQGRGHTAIMLAESARAEEARKELARAVELLPTVASLIAFSDATEAGTWTAWAGGEYKLAARLLGSHRSWLHRGANAHPPQQVAQTQRLEARLREALGPSAYAEETLRGETLSRAQVLEALRALRG